jgi:hypothetical protein
MEKIVTLEEVKAAVQEAGFHFIADRHLSSHPDDWYLRVVLAFRESPRKEYVTWIYNASLGGLHEGRYTQDQQQASDDFHNRK